MNSKRGFIRSLYHIPAIDGADQRSVGAEPIIVRPAWHGGDRRFTRRDAIKAILATGIAPGLIGLHDVEYAEAQENVYGNKVNRTAASGGGSCPADGSAQIVTSGSAIAAYMPALSVYFGQSQWNDGGTPINICKLGFQLGNSFGNISTFNFAASIWSMTGTALNTKLATSNTVAGSNAWSSTMVRFPFATPFTTSASTNYALVLYRTDLATDGTNNTKTYANTVSQIVGFWDRWSAALACTNCAGTVDAVMEIYHT